MNHRSNLEFLNCFWILFFKPSYFITFYDQTYIEDFKKKSKKVYFVFGQGRFFFQPLRNEILQDGLYICPKQRQIARIFTIWNQLFITIPFFKCVYAQHVVCDVWPDETIKEHINITRLCFYLMLQSAVAFILQKPCAMRRLEKKITW